MPSACNKLRYDHVAVTLYGIGLGQMEPRSLVVTPSSETIAVHLLGLIMLRGMGMRTMECKCVKFDLGGVGVWHFSGQALPQIC